MSEQQNTEAAAPDVAPDVEPSKKPRGKKAPVVDLDSRRPTRDAEEAGPGSGGSGGGGGGSDKPKVREVEIWDEFEATNKGLYKVKRSYNSETDTTTKSMIGLLEVRVRLGARIVEDLCDENPALVTHYDLIADDGAGHEHVLRAVDMDRWKACSWVNELPVAASFNDTPSGRSTLRQAIIKTSGAVPLTTMYGVLGWQHIGGRWVYLHAGGAIDANGPAPEIRVNVPSMLAPFRLPAPPSTVEGLRDAVLASTALLDVAPLRVAAPLLAAAYRAPLGFSRVTVMPVGPRSSFKTSLAAYAVQHGAPGARHDKLPGAGAGEDAGTGPGLEELRYRAGDLLLPMDDLAPDRGTERASMRCALIARSQFNRKGKVRSTRTGGLRVEHPPRSLPLVTGEESTTVESAETRIVLLKVARGDVLKHDMAALDTGEEPMHRARLTAAMVRHYAPKKGDLDEGWLKTTRDKLADELADPEAVDAGLDARYSESLADLAVGWRAMLDMATHRKALSKKEAADLWARAWSGLVECKRHQLAGAASRTPADRVRELLRTMLMQRRASLRSLGDGVPAEAAVCGWEPDQTVMPPSWRERGDCVGWTDGTKVWLSPGAAHDAVTSQARREEDPLTYTQRGLADALASQGVIRTEERKGIRYTSVRAPRIGSGSATTRPRTWEFTWEWLFGDDGDPSGDLAEVVAPTPPPPVDLPDRIGPLGSQRGSEGRSRPGRGEESLAGNTPQGKTSAAQPPASPSVGNHTTMPPVAAQSGPEALQRPKSGQGPRPTRRAKRGAALKVEPSEIQQAQKWAEDIDKTLTPERAAAAVERFHLATGCRWSGSHGTIHALLSGHVKWKGAKAPQPCDLGLFDELRDSDRFWVARSWILNPGDPAEDAVIAGLDANMQYVAAAVSVELGEGDPIHYEAGDPLPKNVTKLPGWVRLGKTVKNAPHGLDLPAKMWVPTPIAEYLTRDHKLQLDVVEALVWTVKRKALLSLGNHFRDFALGLKADNSEAGRDALEMVKTLYSKALGGYLSPQTEGMTPKEWRRPDWAMLLKAQAEANMLRALDKLPPGCVPRAKLADAVFVEVPAASAAAWSAAAEAMLSGAWTKQHDEAIGWGGDRTRLDPVASGRFKFMGHALPASAFRGLPHSEAWRAAYADGDQEVRS